MNNKALTMALVLAALAVFFVDSYVTNIEEESKRRLGTEILVIKATQDIKENETITEAMLGLEVMPKIFSEPSAITFAKSAGEGASQAIKRLAGAVALIPIKKGEQVTWNKIIEPGMRTGLASQITPGKRAVAVPVDDVKSVSRLIKPGDRVDVVATLDLGQNKQSKVTKTILQDVFVLAVGQFISGNVARSVEKEGNNEKVIDLNRNVNYNSVTLEVDPVQAAYLSAALANNESGVSLVLRNSDDSDRVSVPAVSLEDLVGSDMAKFNRAPAKK